MLKKVVLALLLAFIIEHTPWTLLALLSESMVLRPGLTKVVKGTDHYWECRALDLRLTGLGWTVSYVSHLRNGLEEVYGLTNLANHTIQVDADLEWNARYAILAHEGGHALMSVYEWGDEGDAEAFAEAIGALVAGDGIREHARYLSTRKLNLLNITVLKADRIYRAAAMLQE